MASNFKKYYYMLMVTQLNMDENTTYDLTQNVEKFTIINDYKNNIFPISRITLNLSKREYLYIRDNSVRLKLSLLKRSLRDADDTESFDSMNDELSVFDNVIFEIIDKNFIEYDETRLDDDINAYIGITYSLFAVDHLSANKFFINGCYLNVRPIDVLAYLDRAGNNNIYIEKPMNDNVYEQIIVPPINATSLPSYLENTYGMYKNDLRVFFDYNEWYILDSELTNATPTAREEYNKVLLDLVRDQDAITQYPLDYGYKSRISNYYYIKINAKKFKIVEKDRAKDEILGSHKIVLQRDEKLNTHLEEFDTTDKIVAKTKVYVDRLNDIFATENINSIENKEHAFFNFSNLDYDAFKVNKRFICTFNDYKYEFKVEKLHMEFIKDSSSGAMNMSGTVILEEN